jgi:hypothetical protein
MTHGALRVSAIALGVAGLVSMSSISTVRADASATTGTTSATSGATPSLAEPAPTPDWATSLGIGEKAVQEGPAPRHHAYHYARRGHRYARYDNNPVANAAAGFVGGVADLGAIAAYPIYCFPNYGSCPVYRPY